MASKEPKYYKSLTIEVVKELAATLIEAADKYPLQFRTEKDFYPLVHAYLKGRVPGVTPEHRIPDLGYVDFLVGGTNRGVLEIVVAPRRLADRDNPDQTFPGHEGGPQLYASQNKRELEKLGGIPQKRAKNRYLLLLDLRGIQDPAKLKAGYSELAPGGRGRSPIRVVYATTGKDPVNFVVGGKKRAKKAKKS